MAWRGPPSELRQVPQPSQELGAALPLQWLPEELEEVGKELNRNLICSGIDVDLASRNWGDLGEWGLRGFLNQRLSGAVA